MIYLGCSGWSYPDWVGPFYPRKATEKLSFYSGIFNTVEINTTFYRIPDAGMVTGWMKRVSNRDFKFSVKFPGQVTHKDILGDLERAVTTSVDFEERYLKPMAMENRLAAVLLQLPPYFTIKSTHRLATLLKSLNTDAIGYFVEPRHQTLYGNSQFREEIASAGAGVVEIDGPEKEFLDISSTGKSFYMRLHGRNYDLWNRKTDTPSERYDYEYSTEDLKPISEVIRKNIGKYEDAFIYFNNHPRGKAPRNAMALSTLLGLPRDTPQKRLI
ncbi:hypothetical protein IX51_06395 [uncultured archaeon]|nr:hypothetical protein IX51_06395 [uncultured archaeon]